ncbi:MAG: ABC transporter ATP-binding protein [Bacilli bacterium]|nr:ABC transporter ATP-binding protein [Bacilli bacterium]
MKKILEINNLKKIYHTPKEEILALDNISFSVNEGEFISIVGPSGCGKSTILSILSNLLNKSSGEINLKNNYIMAYMLQNDSLLPFRTVLDNCLIGLEIQHLLNEENKNYVINLLNTYGLGEFINKYPNSLSGGMRQRCALIRTLAVRPDILLLDEATSALDYQSRLAISDDIYNIIKKEGKTAIMVTHDIAQAISMSDKVIVLSKRPATIKSIYEINLTNKSTPTENRKANNFNYYYDMIWSDLDVNI